MIDAPLFFLLGLGLGIALALWFSLRNHTVGQQQTGDTLANLRHNATQAGLYDTAERRREASVPAPLEMPEKPKRGRPKKLPVLEPQREPLIFTRNRRGTGKLN